MLNSTFIFFQLALDRIFCVGISSANANPDFWRDERPKTDFKKHSVGFDKIMSGGPPKDRIPSIDEPKFEPVTGYKDIFESEPVIGVILNGKARAYPLRLLIWHEIVNDTLDWVPITVTYCPLCNSTIVFDRRLLDFGTTGKLRNSDMVMYDRQTELWWQQFLGEGIIGAMTGKRLKILPARLESFANFKKRAPRDSKILVPKYHSMRPYGNNPYAKYDAASVPFLYRGEMPKGIEPMIRIVAEDNSAWSMPLLVKKRSY
jgi:hypothetical protein